LQRTFKKKPSDEDLEVSFLKILSASFLNIGKPPLKKSERLFGRLLGPFFPIRSRI